VRPLPAGKLVVVITGLYDAICLRHGDRPEVLDVLTEMDVAEAGAAVTTPHDVELILNRPADLDRDSRAMVQGSRIAGFATLDLLLDRQQVRAALGFRPGHVDRVAAPLLGWVEDRARELTDAQRWSTPVTVTWQLPGAIADPTLRARRWSVVRRFSHLRAELDRLPEPPSTPAGVSIDVAADAGAAECVHQVLEEALAQHWEHRPVPTQRFLTGERAAAGYDPSLWFVARLNGRPAAAVIGRRSGIQGWIGWLGTRPAHRGRGLARLLLSTAMTALARAGSTQIALDVDTGNDTGALRLYESMGFAVHYQADQWRHTTSPTAR